ITVSRDEVDNGGGGKGRATGSVEKYHADVSPTAEMSGSSISLHSGTDRAERIAEHCGCSLKFEWTFHCRARNRKRRQSDCAKCQSHKPSKGSFSHVCNLLLLKG